MTMAQTEDEYQSTSRWTNAPIEFVRPELPHMLTIGLRQWSVVVVSIIPPCKGDGCWGYTDAKHHILWIRSGQAIQQEQDTLIHEVTHAAFIEAGISLDTQERRQRQNIHSLIWKFAKAWQQILNDNPSLASYLCAQ